ncbi:MAG: O-antigen polymerase [Acidobacteriaceae bacterium]|nr:O-antigen polymerase [Acidobacteriaceae bacterium]
MTAPLPLAHLPTEAVEPKPARLPRDSKILFSLTALLMFCPLAFGAVEPWAIFILQAASALLFIIWAIGQLRSPQVSIQWSPLFAPALAFAGLMCVQLLRGVSAYRQATYSQLLLYVSYGIACFLLVQTLTRSREVRKVGKALTAYGAAIALFAVLQNLSSPNKLYWLRTPHGGWIYGPYVNHNHYAGLMEMLIPVPLVFAFSRFGSRRERWIAASIAAFMGATIFLSGSRGGMIAFAVEIAIFVAFIVREQQKQNVAILLSAFLLISLGVIAWTGGSEVKARIATLGGDKHSDLSANMREQIDRDILRMSRQRPLLGWGQGTFADVYPRFRSFYTDSLVNAAHNDFLQVLAETGILGFGILIWFLVRVLRPALRKSHKWPSNLNGAVSVAAILGISGILVHSLVDFNMQVPANAALFYSLCTVASMEPRFRTHRRSHRQLEAECFEESRESVNI